MRSLGLVPPVAPTGPSHSGSRRRGLMVERRREAEGLGASVPINGTGYEIASSAVSSGADGRRRINGPPGARSEDEWWRDGPRSRSAAVLAPTFIEAARFDAGAEPGNYTAASDSISVRKDFRSLAIVPSQEWVRYFLCAQAGSPELV